MKVAPLEGAALIAALPDVARLRIEVFREWPYLYDGDLEYEKRYLQHYRKSENAILVGAEADGRLVGAATGTPLRDHADDFAQAFDSTGIAIDRIFYCAESVLLPAYRGHGVGHQFFDLREAHARKLGFEFCCFCAVMRPDDPAQRPADYRPLAPFWRARGYRPLPGVVASFRWKDLGQTAETAKPLQFWMRAL